MSTKQQSICQLLAFLCIGIFWAGIVSAEFDPQAETGDALFRDGGSTHAAIYYGYYQVLVDGQYRHRVIQASGFWYSIGYALFNDLDPYPSFMAGYPSGNYTKQGLGPRNASSHGTWDGTTCEMTSKRRSVIITESIRLIGAGVAYPSLIAVAGTLWEPTSLNPRSTPIGTPTLMRCDGLVEWVYEKAGFNTCNNVSTFTYWALQTPSYHAADWMPASVDAPFTTLKDDGSTYTITAHDYSSTMKTYVNIVYPDKTTDFLLSPAPITKQAGTTFYQAVDFAGHVGTMNHFSYSPQGQPNLTIVEPVVVSPTSIVPGGTIQVGWTEKNQGTAASNPAHYTGISLSSTAHGTTYQIGYYGPMPKLGISATQPYSRSIAVPASIPAGDYYVTAFIDCEQQVSDSDKNNNIGSSSPSKLSVVIPQTVPSKPTSPSPISGLPGQSVIPILSWANGGGAESYDVYFNNQFKGNQTATSYSPGILAFNTTYSWQINAHNSVGVTLGDPWTFTTEVAPLQPPSKVTSPNPVSGVTGQSINTSLSWANGGGAESYDVYFNNQFKVNQTTTSYSPGILAYNTTYSWQINAHNSVGVTLGDPWTFTTVGGASTAPIVTSISPAWGATTGGTVVTIAGTNLNNGPVIVYFGTTWALISGASDSQIIVTSPAGTEGTVDITIVNAGGTSQISSADRFTYATPVPVGLAYIEVDGWYSGNAVNVLSMQNPALSDGTYFGTVNQNSTPPTRTYTVHNTGSAPLTLETPTLPLGFTIVEPLNSTIPEYGSDNFTVQMSTSTGGGLGGYISFRNNAGDSGNGIQNPFSFAIGGMVTFAGAAPTSAVLDVSPSVAVYGQAVTLSAAVGIIPPGSGTPTGGTVTFMVGTTPLGSTTLNNGTAVFNTTALPVGLQSVTAIYSGDGSKYATSTTSLGSNLILGTIAGGGSGGDGGSAMNALLSSPYGIAIDSSGNLFIADTGNYVVRKVDHSTGIITTVAGNGTLGYNGDNIQATSAELNAPYGIAVDTSGHLFIADSGNMRVRKVDLSTGIITTVAGRGVYDPPLGDNGPATAASLCFPRGVAVDTNGNLFISDTQNDRIRKVDHSTGIITTVAGNGTTGFGGDGSSATSASLNNPSSVAVNGSGNLFIVDYANNRIREVNHSTGIIITVAGNGIAGFGGDGNSATSASLNSPYGVAVDGSGNLFITDNGRVRKVNLTTGIITTVAGGGDSFVENSPAITASLAYSAGVALDSMGNIFVSDYMHNRIRKITTGNLSVNIAPATLTATADNKSRIYGDLNPPFTATISGFQNNETLDTSGISGNPSMTSSATATSPVSNYTISTGLGTLTSQNYTFQFANGTLSVTPATLMVAADNKNRMFGDPNPTFTVSYAGFQNGETLAISGANGTPSITCSATASSSAGNYVISTGLGTLAAENYNFIFLNGTLMVTKGSQTITFPTLPSKVYGDADFSPNATATSGLDVTYASSNLSVATIVSGKIHITGVGTTTITARQAGYGNWYAADDVEQILTVSAIIQASAGAFGSISPSGNIVIDYGTDKSFTINPDTGYQVEDVLVDGTSAGAVSSYKFTNVTASHTIYATFTVASGQYGDFKYTGNGAGITITGYTGPGGGVNIPEMIDGKKVTGIGNNAFYCCNSLTNVTIPSYVTSIGNWAFFWCSNLLSVTIPDSVTSIGDCAFYSCGLTNVTIPKNVNNIGYKVFWGCTNLTAISVDVLNSVYSSADGVLYDTGKTTLIQCPGGKAGSYTIPNSVKNIEDGALQNCTNLTAIFVDVLNSVYSSADGVLYDTGKTTLIQCPGGKAGSYTIPNSVKSIENYAFYNCASINSVTIPSSVISIGNGTFCSCTNLTSVLIPGSVTSA